MTAFLKIDQCKDCHRQLPWEWAPAVLLNGRTLAGTGVWGSQLSDGRCPACQAALETDRRNKQQELRKRLDLVALLGGEKPYREFTFERYQVTPGNTLAFESCRSFNPALDNLYLWGPCGVGKTHLAYASARRCSEESLRVAILSAPQLSRQIRTKDPVQEQSAIDQFVQSEALILDDLGAGQNSPYSRQLLREILDGRDFAGRAGLVVASNYSLDQLASQLTDDSVPSRLAGLCRIIEIHGPDVRLTIRKEAT